MYSAPEQENSPPDSGNSPTSGQRTKPGSYGKACDTCRKKKARCNFGKPTCGYCSAFKHACSYSAATACATRRNAKKLSIETKRQRPPSLPVRKSSVGSYKQPYSAEPTSPHGYLTPVTPLDRRLHSAGAGGYHHIRVETMGSSPTGRSVYSPDSTSPSIPISRTFQMRQEDADPSSINAHVQPRPYQPQQVRPYGHNPNGYLPDNRAMVSATDGQRPTAYMAVPLMDQQAKEHQAQAHMMESSATDSPHSYSQSDLHHEEQIQRVVSPTSQASLGHYQTQYTGYEVYHHRTDLDNSQHDPRQQIQQDWPTRRQSAQLATQEQRAMYRYHEVESQNGYIR
jgi:hypothetical protein